MRRFGDRLKAEQAAKDTLQARKALQAAYQAGDQQAIVVARAHVEACFLAELQIEEETHARRR